MATDFLSKRGCGHSAAGLKGRSLVSAGCERHVSHLTRVEDARLSKEFFAFRSCENAENGDKVFPIGTGWRRCFQLLGALPARGPCGIPGRTLKPKHARIDLILSLLKQEGSGWGDSPSVLCSKELGIF